MAFKITTTGTQSPVTFSDLGGRSFTHPTSNYDLSTEYTMSEIGNSMDVKTAIDNGHITAVDENGYSISTDSINKQPIKGETPTLTIATGDIAIYTAEFNFKPNTLEVFLNGVKLKEDKDYEVSDNNEFTFLRPVPPSGEWVTVNYVVL